MPASQQSWMVLKFGTSISIMGVIYLGFNLVSSIDTFCPAKLASPATGDVQTNF